MTDAEGRKRRRIMEMIWKKNGEDSGMLQEMDAGAGGDVSGMTEK